MWIWQYHSCHMKVNWSHMWMWQYHSCYMKVNWRVICECDNIIHSHMTPIYLHITTMILSHSHMTLQFTFIWQLWYCHIHIWLPNLPSYNKLDIVIFTYDSPIYLHMTTMILSHSHMTSIYLHMTTMILSHSHMTLQFTFI
jgi:hypothetical protein